MHERKQFGSSERSTAAIIAANLLGWQTQLAPCSLVLHDVGFQCVVGNKSIDNWLKQIESAVSNGNVRNAIKTKHNGRIGTGYTYCISCSHPTYLHEMFQHSRTLLGDNATYKEIAGLMNLQSAGLENLPTLTLNKIVF
jgi:hypothetical protein